MMKENYILPLSKLLPGDILLMKEDDTMGQVVMDMAKSTYSHATIYLGDSSYAESTVDRGVIANNLQRVLFKHLDDVVVLRLKLSYFDTCLIEKAIYRTRDLIGTSYGVLEAVRIAEMDRRPENGQPLSPNRQTCTRLVAQAFHDAGLDIVKNYAYCSPEEILKSDKLFVTPITAVPATQEDIDFANSENPIYDFVEAQFQLLLCSRKVTGSDLQTIRQVSDYVIENPQYDEPLCKVLRESDYLNIYKREEELNPWHYDKGQFMKRYKGNEILVAHGLKRTTLNLLSLYKSNLEAISSAYSSTNLEYLGLMKTLYENLVKQCQERISLTDDILTDVDLVIFG